MTPVVLSPVADLTPRVERLLQQIVPQLAALVPDAEAHHIGATAIPGSITKGDVDILIRVSGERFATALGTLRKNFGVKQPENWTAEFASFGDDTSYELPLGIQLTVIDSKDDFFLFLRDYFISNPDALKEYNRLKLAHAHEGAQEYWKAKDAFLSKILASRKNNR